MPFTTQNWDGVTAPALPTGWTYDTNFDTSTTVANSALNSLRCTGMATVKCAYYSSQDTNGGNETVSSLVYVTSTGVQARLIARATVAPVGAAGTYYYANLKVGTGLSLNKRIVGVGSIIGSPVGTTAFAVNTQYLIAFTPSGTSMSITCQRVSDGFYLTSAGAFAAGAATCISTTDSSIPAAVGWAGVSSNAASVSDIVYFDDFIFDLAPGSLASAAGIGVATGTATLNPGGTGLSSSAGTGVATGAGTLKTAVPLASSSGIGVATGTAALNPGGTGLSSSAGVGVATGAGTLRTAVPVASATGTGIATGAGTLSPGVALSSSSGTGVATGAGTLATAVPLASSSGTGVATGTAALNPGSTGLSSSTGIGIATGAGTLTTAVSLSSSAGAGIATGTAVLNPGGTGLSSSAGTGVATGAGTLKTAVPVASSSGTGIATGAGTLATAVALASSSGTGVATGAGTLGVSGAGAGGCQTITGSPTNFTASPTLMICSFIIPVGVYLSGSWNIASATIGGAGSYVEQVLTGGGAHAASFAAHNANVTLTSTPLTAAQLADINSLAGSTLNAGFLTNISSESITGFTLTICPNAAPLPVASSSGTGVATGAGTLATTVNLSGSATGVATGAASFPAPPAVGGVLAAVADENIVLFASVSMGLSAIVDDSYVGTGSQGSGIN